MSYLMGIDLGTSSVKAVIADENGSIQGIGQEEYPVLTPEYGSVEQNPHVWWEKTKLAIGGAMKKAGIPARQLTAISFSGQMHGLTALDENGEAVCNSLIHLDARSLKERQEIIRSGRDLMEIQLLNQPSTGMLICSLLWICRNRPEIYDKIAYVMSPKDYIRYRLTDVISTEYSDASATLAFSLRDGCWCTELIHRLGLKEDIWPEVHRSTDYVGNVSAKAAKETGLSEQTKVISGCGDCFAAMIGNGVVEEGIVSCNIGTAAQVAVLTAKPVFDAGMRCQLWYHAMPGMWSFQGGALNGGNALSWLRNKALETGKPFAQMDAEALKVPAGSGGLFFLPYLSGERTPYNNPQARGVYFGLTLKHDQPQIIRATMEGVLYNLCSCRDIFTEAGIVQNRLIASGGGAKGETWKQIQADMMDMPVYTTKTVEEACIGAIILASVGAGIYTDIPQACQAMVQFSDRVTLPDPENVKIYAEKKEFFRELYRSAEKFFG